MQKYYLIVGGITLFAVILGLVCSAFNSNDSIHSEGVLNCNGCIATSSEIVESSNRTYKAKIEIKGTNVSNNYTILFAGNVDSDLDQFEPVAKFNILENQVGI